MGGFRVWRADLFSGFFQVERSRQIESETRQGLEEALGQVIGVSLTFVRLDWQRDARPLSPPRISLLCAGRRQGRGTPS